MPLFFETLVKIEKVKLSSDNNSIKEYREEQYTTDEVVEFSDAITKLVPTDFIHKGRQYTLTVDSVAYVTPSKKTLSELEISLPELRTAIAHQMSHGNNSMNVTDLLELVRGVYINNRG